MSLRGGCPTFSPIRKRPSRREHHVCSARHGEAAPTVSPALHQKSAAARRPVSPATRAAPAAPATPAASAARAATNRRRVVDSSSSDEESPALHQKSAAARRPVSPATRAAPAAPATPAATAVAATPAASAARAATKRRRVVDSSSSDEESPALSLSAAAAAATALEEGGEQSDDEPAPKRAVPTCRPLVKGRLPGRKVLVPATQYPQETCLVNGGQGWAARVQNVKRCIAMLKLDGCSSAGHAWELVYIHQDTVLGWQPLR